MISREERQAALKNATVENTEKRNEKYASPKRGKSFLDLSNYDGVEWYEVKEDLNRFDILTYIVATNNHPNGIRKGYEYYNIDIWVHRGVGPRNSSFICMEKMFGLPCAICDDRKSRLKAGVDYKSDEIQQLVPSRRVLYNVKDRITNDNKLRLFIASYKYFEKEMLDEVEYLKNGGQVVVFSDLEKGKTIEFRAIKNTYKTFNYFTYKKFNFVDRNSYPESILEETIPLDAILVRPEYEEVRNEHLGIFDDEDVDDESEDSIEHTNSVGKTSPYNVQSNTETANVDDTNITPQNNNTKQSSGVNTNQNSVNNPNNCPYNHSFGVDCDNKKECDGCKKWDACAEEEIRLKKLAKKNKAINNSGEIPF